MATKLTNDRKNAKIARLQEENVRLRNLLRKTIEPLEGYTKEQIGYSKQDVIDEILSEIYETEVAFFAKMRQEASHAIEVKDK